MFPWVGKVLLIIIISAGPIYLTGCSTMRPVGDFVSQRYINTVSYFNTFYNAEKVFQEAVGEVGDAEKRHQEQGRGGQFEVPQQTRQKFNDVIEKCSRLLHQYPMSKYADDAVLMIGKSYYHMRQNIQAERKFLELLAEFPNSAHVSEAQLLLAKSQRRMNKHGEAQIALENLVGRLESRSDRDIAALARIELGDIHRQNENLENAIEEFLLAIGTARDRTIRAEARFNLAKAYYDLEQYDTAFHEYTQVIDDRPTNRILFELQIAKARILTNQEKYDEGIDLLESLLSDLRLAEYISRIELEAAHIYRNQGALNNAIDQYVYVDTTYARTVVSTEAQYTLASIYKETLGDYKKAKEYFEKVSRATPPSDMTRSAWAKNDNLAKYQKHKDEITRLDSVITNQKIKLVELEKELAELGANSAPDTILADTTMISDDMVQTIEQNRESVISSSPEEIRNQIASDSHDLVRNYYELAGLFYIELERPDSAAHYYAILAHHFPESQYAPQALYALGEILRVISDEETTGIVSELFINMQYPHQEAESWRDYVYTLLIDKYPDTEFALEAMRILGMDIPRVESDPLEELYQQAEAALVENKYDDALYLLEYIARDTSGSQYAIQASYTIGWMYENIFIVPDSAVAYYQKLVERYPDTQFAAVVQNKVNAWHEHIAEQERVEQESEQTDESEMEGIETSVEEVGEIVIPDRVIPFARPTDIKGTEEKPDTTRTRKQNEN
jgi:TolA-binding protein